MRTVAGAMLVFAGLASAGDVASQRDARALWQQSLAAQRFQDLRTIGTLTTRFPSGDEVVLEVELLASLQSDGVSRMGLTRVVSGNALVNSTFLNIERPNAADDLWIYLPTVGTPRRLVASNLGDSYLGSEFRYGDLVQRDPEQHEATRRGDESIEGEACIVIELVPKTARIARDAGLGREVLWLRAGSLIERRVEQFDLRGRLLKVIDFDRILVDSRSGKSFPLERRIRNVQSGATSAASFRDVRTNQGLPADLFSPSRLSDRSW